MKLILQITLIILLIIISYVFYENYFQEKKIVDIKTELLVTNETKKNPDESKLEQEKNIIKNLTYNVDLTESGRYEIKSDLGELIIKDGTEIVVMNNVTAIFSDKDNKELYIFSDYAEFNTNNYNTLFRKNIKIKYEDNIITSNNLNFDFIKNNILVHENVIYTGIHGKIQTDNIKIDLITKNVEIYMNDSNKNIKIVSF